MQFDARPFFNIIKTHIYAFLRAMALIILFKVIAETEVKSVASMNEKTWTLNVLGVFIAFFIIVWMIQCTILYSTANGFSAKLVFFIIYVFVNMLDDIFDYLSKGFQLNTHLTGEDAVIDSMLIHYTRLTLLWIISIFFFGLLLTTIVICIVVRNQVNENRGPHSDVPDRDFLSRLKHVPYG